MRIPFLLVALLFLSPAYSQKREFKLDENYNETTGKDARYKAETELRDSLWFTKVTDQYGFPAMTGSFKDEANKIHHGLFSYYYPNGEKVKQGIYVEGKKQGAWIRKDVFGSKESLTFRDGFLRGSQFEWYESGFDSSWFDGEGNGNLWGFHKNKALRVHGTFVNDTAKHGEWKYFDSTGKNVAFELYDSGKLLTLRCYDERGDQRDSSTCTEQEAKFGKGMKDWKRYLAKKLDAELPIRAKAKKGSYTVVIAFKINREGYVVDCVPLTRHGYEMEEEVMRVLRSSPRWQPAYKFGRTVIAYKIQPITFFAE